MLQSHLGVARLKWIALAALSLAALSLLMPSAANCANLSSRQRILMDAGWRFYEEPNPTAPAGDWGSPDTTWEYTSSGVTINTTPQSIAAQSPAPTWTSYTVGTDAFGGQPGFAYFRSIISGGGQTPENIRFDSVDDNGWVFLNGQMIGANQGWNLPFSVSPGSAWSTTGPNVLDVLIQNTGGPGGLDEPVNIQYGPPPTPADAQPSFDDSAWQTVHLPHDYVVQGTFSPSADTGHGSLPVTTAWYRNTFSVPSSDKGDSVWLDFDGVYRDAWVWINGNFLGENKSGYSSFRFDVTPYLNYGGTNVVAVHVDPTFFEGWWYEGGGIYRHVWLIVADPVHVAPDGTFVTTNVNLSVPSATIDIQTQLVNESAVAEKCMLVSTVNRPKGVLLGSVATKETIPADTTITLTQSISEPAAQLWSLTTPAMYSVVSRVEQAGNVVDTYKTPFGIRTEYFDPNLGFFLNGKSVKLQGACNHQDAVAVGIGVPDSMLLWRLEKLKAMGCNTYRTSHNEVASELLDDCDTLGILVMDETRHLGDTYQPKTEVGTPATSLADFKQQLRRDRNHPSVILWSLCNEEWNAIGDPSWGIPEVQAMHDVADQYDGTRPTTCADYGVLYPAVDVVGYQYSIGVYDSFHAGDPSQPIFCSEGSSEVGTRGEYVNDTTDGWVWAYDIESPDVSWGASAEDAWNAIQTRPFMAGSMVWTGFDYRGEPTPYGWPDVSSNFGIMDLCGFPKDNYYYYQSIWTSAPIVHIVPHWNWSGERGHAISVWAFTNAASVELFLNGKSLGVQTPAQNYGVQWSVPYEPGTLKAKAYDASGATIATDTVVTTGAPAGIVLKPSTKSLTCDGEDASMVEANIVDKDGRIVPVASNEVTFAVSGPGQITGTGNGNPSSHELNTSPTRAAFNGKCMAVIQSFDGAPGTILLTAASPGLTPVAITIASNP
jgi:beta-galactosidase